MVRVSDEYVDVLSQLSIIHKHIGMAPNMSMVRGGVNAPRELLYDFIWPVVSDATAGWRTSSGAGSDSISSDSSMHKRILPCEFCKKEFYDVWVAENERGERPTFLFSYQFDDFVKNVDLNRFSDPYVVNNVSVYVPRQASSVIKRAISAEPRSVVLVTSFPFNYVIGCALDDVLSEFVRLLLAESAFTEHYLLNSEDGLSGTRNLLMDMAGKKIRGAF